MRRLAALRVHFLGATRAGASLEGFGSVDALAGLPKLPSGDPALRLIARLSSEAQALVGNGSRSGAAVPLDRRTLPIRPL
jgi:hypothetical protein